MAIIEGWLPPTREHWELISCAWQFFPLLTAIQWLTSFYPQGKTSIDSRYNLPGKWAWFAMEIPGALTLWYCLLATKTSQHLSTLPWGNWTMAGVYTLHYSYRAVLAPLVLNPSMSPIHPLVAVSAACWQVTNGLCLGGWLGGYGPTTVMDWSGKLYMCEIGLVIWGWAFLGNLFHDDDLREIRRSALRRQKAAAAKEGKQGVEGVEKLYMVPKNGLFHFVLYPHYLCEWIEWFGFWMVSGFECGPARSFLLNEVATMLPRALQGRQWYLRKFGRERIGNRKAVIPGLL